MQQPEPLGRKLGIHIAHAGDIAAGSVDAIDETDLDRVGRGAEHDRNGRGGGLRGDRSDHGARCREYSHPATHQIGRQFRQPIVLIRRESVFDFDVTTLFIAGLAQAFGECRYESFHPLGRTRPKKPDHWHRRLLRTRAERPCSRRTAEQRDELAPPHSITSSAIASTFDGMVIPSALAVFRLITSSYLFAPCTPTSAAFSPFPLPSPYP